MWYSESVIALQAVSSLDTNICLLMQTLNVINIRIIHFIFSILLFVFISLFIILVVLGPRVFERKLWDQILKEINTQSVNL